MLTLSIFSFLYEPLLALAGGVWGLLAVVVAFLAKNYLVPYLEVERHRRYAEWIAHIADEVTDDLVARYPNQRLLEFLDESVDKVMEICGIPDESARRAVKAAVIRKEKAQAS